MYPTNLKAEVHHHRSKWAPCWWERRKSEVSVVRRSGNRLLDTWSHVHYSVFQPQCRSFSIVGYMSVQNASKCHLETSKKGSSFETGWRFVTKRKGPSCLSKSVSFWCMEVEVQQVFSIGYSSKMTCLGNGWMGIQLGLKIVFLSRPTLLSTLENHGKAWMY